MDIYSQIQYSEASKELSGWIRDSGHLYDMLATRLAQMKNIGLRPGDCNDRDYGLFRVALAMAKWLDNLQTQTCAWIHQGPPLTPHFLQNDLLRSTVARDAVKQILPMPMMGDRVLLNRIALYDAYDELVAARERRHRALLVLGQQASKPVFTTPHDGKVLHLR